MVAVGCEQVWQEISNYIDGEIDPKLRSAVDDHLGQCARCTAVVEGTRNIVHLYGDERLFETPMGYSWRLKRRLQSEARPTRRTVLGWGLALATMGLVAGTVELARKRAPSQTAKSALAQRGKGVPDDLKVVANLHGKLFHIEGCPFIDQHDPIKNLTAKEAEKEGFVPCPRCMGEYLKQG